MKSVSTKIVLSSHGQEAYSRWVVSVGAAILDIVVVATIVMGVSAAYRLVSNEFAAPRDTTVELAFVLSSLFFFTNLLQRKYRITDYLSDKGQIVNAFNVWNVTVVAFVAVAFMTRILDHYSRAVVIATYFSGILVVPLARHAFVKLVAHASKTGRIASQRVLLIGRDAEISSFLTRQQPWNSGLFITEIIVLDRLPEGASAEEGEIHMQKALAAAVSRARAIMPDSVFIALPWSERSQIERCVDAFMNAPVSIHLTSEAIMDRFENPKIVRLGSTLSMELSSRPLSSSERIAKRIMDVLGAAVLLTILSPLFAIVALLIKLDSRGPVFFLQRRYGFNQEQFHILKFRTMTTADDGEVVRQAQKNDQRVTPVGKWLRRLNIDELPQLINVLRGQMSLVGPRPHALTHNREFEQKIALYARRHNVKPGLTGWAQVNGLRGPTETDDKMARRVSFDLWYIDNWNFWLDIVIVFRTVFSRQAYNNAY